GVAHSQTNRRAVARHALLDQTGGRCVLPHWWLQQSHDRNPPPVAHRRQTSLAFPPLLPAPLYALPRHPRSESCPFQRALRGSTLKPPGPAARSWNQILRMWRSARHSTGFPLREMPTSLSRQRSRGLRILSCSMYAERQIAFAFFSPVELPSDRSRGCLKTVLSFVIDYVVDRPERKSRDC